MEKLDLKLYELVKSAFMPMPGQPPVAGAGPMTDGMASPMGGDPGMAPPMDPAMAGGDPGMMDPAMAGGDPGMMDPAMLGQMLEQGGGAVGVQITMGVDDLVKLVQGIAAAIKPPKQPQTATDDAGAADPAMADPAMAGAPPMDPAMAGMPAAGGMPPPGMV